MKIGITPRFEESKHGDVWYAFEEKLITFFTLWKPGAEIVTQLPEKEENLSNLDLLILSGGSTPGKNTKRDSFEFELIKKANISKTKIVGICRGAQILTVYFGGSLIETRGHINAVRNLSGSTENIGRCFHNFAINNLPSNFEVLGRDIKDNSIEIFFDTDQNMLGVMSHPERESNSLQNFDKLLKRIGWEIS